MMSRIRFVSGISEPAKLSIMAPVTRSRSSTSALNGRPTCSARRARKVNWGPPVAFAEGVDRVDLGQQVRGVGREVAQRKAFEGVGVGQQLKDVLQLRLNVLRVAEPVTAFADPDTAELSGPVVDVLEQVMVERKVVGDVQIALRPVFLGAHDKHGGLVLVELVLVREGQLVPEHGRAWIAEGIGFGSIDQRLDGLTGELSTDRLAAFLRGLILGLGKKLAHARAEHQAFDRTDLFGPRLCQAASCGAAGSLGRFDRAHEIKAITSSWRPAKEFLTADLPTRTDVRHASAAVPEGTAARFASAGEGRLEVQKVLVRETRKERPASL